MMMRASAAMHPTMTPASLAPLNTGSVLDCCAESAEDDEGLGVEEVPASSGTVADWIGTDGVVSGVSSGEPGWVTRNE